MRFNIFFVLILTVLFSHKAEAALVAPVNDSLPAPFIVCLSDDTAFVTVDLPVKDSIVAGETKENKKKKTVAAIFAFPFPFGFIGAHRVMLGTAPWVPVVYAATFGGCFGLLPLIDFFVITFSSDITEYENNPHIFMWVK